MSDRIYFVGDPHGYFRHFMPIVERDQPAAVVLLGDIEADRPLAEILGRWDYDPARIWIIPGNHDVDRLSLWANLSAWRQSGRDLHGQVTEVAGRRIAGLGGWFVSEIWSGWEYDECHRPAQLQLEHHVAIFPEQIKRIRRAGQADILVTHEAGSTHPLGNEALDELAAALGVERHYHGHHHETYAQKAGQGHMVHGVDMAAIVNDLGEIVLDGLSTPTRRT